jgi:hypothetical protein
VIRARIALFALACTGLVTSCYDSRWGEQKKTQRMTASKMAAPELHAESEGPPRRARPMRVRAWITSSYGAQVIDPQHELRELFDDANAVTEPLLGLHLVLDEVKTWELASDDDLQKCLDKLVASDKGDDVDWVAGFVGGLPKTTYSFHDLGRAYIATKHLVVRAPSRADEMDDVERSFSELPEEERRKFRKGKRRHRAGAVFLHELGHTLGSPHTIARGSIMFPAYDPRVSTFGTPVSDVLRAAAENKADPATFRQAIATALRNAPPDVFVPQEREQQIAALTEQPKTIAQPTTPQAPAIPETPKLSPADRERFEKAFIAHKTGDQVTAWESLKPLVSAYPDVMEVQDLRCNVATLVMPFEWARRECDALMNLAKDRNRTR